MTDPQPGTPMPNEERIPQTMPVFDVTFQHIYTGHVHKQFYMFLWIAVAFLVGTILPWRGPDASQVPTVLQAFLIVVSLGCVWSAIASIKGRRLTLWPMMLIELLAVVFLLLHYQHTQDAVRVPIDERIDVLYESAKSLPSGPRRDEVQAEYDRLMAERDAGIVDLAIGHFQHYGKPNTDEAVVFERTWRRFGTGFYLTALTVVFQFFFIVISIAMAVAGSKKNKPEPAPRARRDRGAKPAGDAPKAD